MCPNDSSGILGGSCSGQAEAVNNDVVYCYASFRQVVSHDHSFIEALAPQATTDNDALEHSTLMELQSPVKARSKTVRWCPIWIHGVTQNHCNVGLVDVITHPLDNQCSRCKEERGKSYCRSNRNCTQKSVTNHSFCALGMH